MASELVQLLELLDRITPANNAILLTPPEARRLAKTVRKLLAKPSLGALKRMALEENEDE